MMHLFLKHRKNCESYRTQVTWKILMSVLSVLSFLFVLFVFSVLSVLGHDYFPDHDNHLDHEPHLNHDDHLVPDDYHNCDDLGDQRKQRGNMRTAKENSLEILKWLLICSQDLRGSMRKVR